MGATGDAFVRGIQAARPSMQLGTDDRRLMRAAFCSATSKTMTFHFQGDLFMNHHLSHLLDQQVQREPPPTISADVQPKIPVGPGAPFAAGAAVEFRPGPRTDLLTCFGLIWVDSLKMRIHSLHAMPPHRQRRRRDRGSLANAHRASYSQRGSHSQLDPLMIHVRTTGALSLSSNRR